MSEAAPPARPNLAADPGSEPASERIAPDQPDFIAAQFAFAAHLRDPDHCPPPPGIETRRLTIYRELIFNNVAALLEAGFPVLRQVLGPARWQALIRDFLIEHRAQTPLFTELPQELLDYLGTTRAARHPEDPPFLLELAHYEWVELALGISDAAVDPATYDADGDLLAGVPLVSPLTWNLAYRFPVHRIGPDHQPSTPEPEPTRLLVYRDRHDQVGFLVINSITQRLIERLQQDPPVSGQAALLAIAAELGHADAGPIIAAGSALLADLHRRDIILGTRRRPPSDPASGPHPCGSGSARQSAAAATQSDSSGSKR
ncbi:MAG: DUF2063 domain-containing protein [Chromatiaceae bacterium]|nr:MAG: DUF2063 domain-containing protein [Chromatiaceae bacterium]